MPGWLIGWDVFCWIGHRRFARHWSVPQIRNELRDSYRLRLSPDAISVYIQRYQNMLAARQQDFANLRLAYANIDQVDLTIDGLQPEKGHETLYTILHSAIGKPHFPSIISLAVQNRERPPNRGGCPF
jgi:hypothetical protein